jgi:hypothetical protein
LSAALLEGYCGENSGIFREAADENLYLYFNLSEMNYWIQFFQLHISEYLVICNF